MCHPQLIGSFIRDHKMAAIDTNIRSLAKEGGVFIAWAKQVINLHTIVILLKEKEGDMVSGQTANNA